ncbi:MAG TPA: hypothetical protein VLW75_12085 [Rhizomicrobium sp.]|nr:hypothetical protein [Rhizomicrobium sp.]
MRSFPLLIVAVVIYNLIALVHGFNPDETAALLAINVPLKMFSGQVWHFSVGDLVVVIALGMLFVEVVKATRTTAMEIINHALSMIVFIIALVEFLVFKPFATTPFFLIMVMALFDIVAGFTISIVAAKRDLGVAGGIIGTN